MASVGHSPYTSKPSPLARTTSQTPITPSNLLHASPSPIVPSFPFSQPPTPMKRPLPPENHGSTGGPPERKFSVDSGQGDHGSQQPQKKKRVSLSCAQCAKRKQKCNREFPCQHCVARKVPELCVPYNPQASNNTHGPDPQTAARLESIEAVLSVVVRHTGGITHYDAIRDWISSALPFQKHLQSAPSTPASPHNLMTHGSVPGPSRAGSTYHFEPQEAAHLERGGSSDDDNLAKVGKGWLGEIDGGLPENMELNEKVKMKLDIHGTPAENLQRLITDCGVSPHKIAELVQELPPKPFADRIIDWFFAKLNFIRYPIDERLFRASYEDLYNKSTALDPSNVRALPLVFIVLALAVRQAPEKWAGNEQTRRLSSLRMYWSSRRSILIATAVQSESLELVVSRLLSAMYLVLIHDRRLTECWSQLGASLRTAQAIGLHRDGSKLGLDPFQTEYRRRLWSYLYHADKQYSLVLGRPPSISDSYTDTQTPSNIDLTDYNPALGLPPAKPFHEPTPALFLILRKKLAVVIGKIVHHFQKLNEPAQYSDVEKLQQELDLFVEQLPPHFRMHDPDKSLDSVHFWLPVHRFMLLTEVLVTTIILHRPWLLRKLSSNRYAASRTACFEAAKLDFQIRQDFQRVPDFKLFAITGQFRMFNSAMIAGISAIIDPRGPDSDQMRKILTTFLEDNPWHEVSTKDATTRKEVQIIQTLSRRAAKIFEDSFGPGEPAAHDKDSAALLLALRQSNDSSTHSNAYPKGVQPEDAPTPGGPGLMQHRMMLPPRAWGPPPGVTFAPVHHGGINQSPASTGSHEDDHSQKLLDHWINANTSLAVGGSSTGGALPVLDTSGIGYLPLPTMSGAMTPMGLPGGPGFTSNPAFAGYGGQAIMEDDGNNFMGHHSTSEFTYPNQFGMLAVEGTGVDVGNGRTGHDSGVENSDEYWNTLIDGILGTTGGMSGPSQSGQT
ncbi:hypothetical protein C361_07060 [Cryptococcus neoformans Tu259-1]|uniref:Zn(2)-C6 fungal-type domain-containing protein n=1 Tax=Cryptococcus neoformans Tu259-1 TaxID=1230072 RepID=A0A854Q3T0_CRYNE|nr:hypothetical protein C353_06939 [Cryptococcus neoformans var. grubii AD1-83a]OXG09876.1 hypothetical protein C361_07060 [Cryptococcus neoformans var. grubii Tu259-1]OXG42586.1 hypothetical protein C354_06918 [Cryptococcus neoformans var. grubii MW-RSA1955]OXG47209.1 hypothetical protein C352_06942 [Cryptococcus neoformans var. grubii CHC193]OXG56133.1 hypothetical protein C351_06922 [Cryptococcus neoformans var. grubii c8]OXH00841.1 hypothetical protein C369_07055 [Cryptococcus neoformans v